MTEVRFYHLTRTSLEQALPQMLERCLARDQRALVVAGSAARAEALSEHLWTYAERSFLPHGGPKDGREAEQPVLLTARSPAEGPPANAAEVLFLVDGAAAEGLAPFSLCAILFDGRDSAAVAARRGDWQALKAGGHGLTYWRQDEQGSWRQGAG